MSVLLKFERHDPTPPFTISSDGNAVTQDSTGHIFRRFTISSDGKTVTQDSTSRHFKRVWQTGDPRFTDNNNGTVTDGKTGLIWLKNANAFGSINFIDAEKAVTRLNNGEHALSDGSSEGQWRLPTKYELEKLCHDDHNVFQRPSAPFTAVQSSDYWLSSTETNSTPDGIDTNTELTVILVADMFNRQGTKYVWPVRGAQ
jgi:hypothetical protein